MNLAIAQRQHGFAVNGVLHIGACQLEEADDYQAMDVKTVVWVEAQPHSKARVERAAAFGHTLLEGTPLSDREERVTLRLTNNEGGGSSSCLALKEHTSLFPEITQVGSVELVARRADTVLATLPVEVDALVVDVQGYELRVLKGMGALLDSIRVAFVEVSFVELYEGEELWPEVRAWLEEHGFALRELYPHVSQAWGDALFLKSL